MIKFRVIACVVAIFVVCGCFILGLIFQKTQSRNDSVDFKTFSSFFASINKSQNLSGREKNVDEINVYYLADKDGKKITKDGYDSIVQFFNTKKYKIRKSDNFGVIDENGKYILPLKYNSIRDYRVNNKNYYIAYSVINRKSSLFDENGNEILAGQVISNSHDYFIVTDYNVNDKKYVYSVYDLNFKKIFVSNSCPNFFDGNLIIVKNGEKTTLVGIDGKRYPLVYDSIRYLGKIDGKYIFQVTNGKLSGVADENDRIIIPIKYYRIIYNSGKFMAKYSEDKNVGEETFYFDKNGKLITKNDYEKNNYRINFYHNKSSGDVTVSSSPVRKIHCNDEKYDLFDENNQPITRKGYSKIRYLNNNHFMVKNDEKSAIIDFDGKIVVPFGICNDFVKDRNYIVGTKVPNLFIDKFYYKIVTNKSRFLDKNGFYSWLNKSYLIFLRDRRVKYRLYNQNFKQLCTFSAVSYPTFVDENLLIIAEKINRYSLINSKGKNVLHTKFEDLRLLNWKGDKFFAKKHGKVGVISKDGKTIIPFKYEQISFADTDKYFAQKNGKWGIIKEKNEVILPFVSFEQPRIINDNLYIISEQVVLTQEQKELLNKEKNTIRTRNKEIFSENRKFSPEGDLHVVCVYEGDKHKNGKVVINVEITDKPISLLLTSYEGVEWKINLKNGAKVKKIYYSGYYDQKISCNKKVESEKLDERIHLDEFDFDKVEALSGKAPSTYQYKYSGDSFFVDGKSGSKMTFFKHPSTNKKVLFERNDLTRKSISSDGMSLSYEKSGAYSFAMANKFYRKGDGKYYFEAKFTNKNSEFPTFSNVGVVSILNEFTYCDLDNSEGGCLAYPVLNNFDENLPSNFVVGIAIDLDNGKLYSSMNGKWLDFDEKFVALSKINNKNGFFEKNIRPTKIIFNKGNDYTPAAQVSDRGKWTMNFGASKFKYPVPEGFKPYDTYSSKKK